MIVPKLLLFALVLVAGSALCARPAAAQEPNARCVVQIMQAVEIQPPPPPPTPQLEPKIEALRPYLSQAPFTAWQKFALLDEKTIELAPKAGHDFQLPNGKPATFTFLEHMPISKKGRHRVRVQLQIGDPAKRALSTIFIAPEGKVVLQVLQMPHPKDKGLLVLGTSCNEAGVATAPAAPSQH